MYLFIYQLSPSGHFAVMDTPLSDKHWIHAKSYSRFTGTNFRYYGLSLLRNYGHLIRSQRLISLNILMTF